MIKSIVLMIGCLILLASAVSAQEVIIADFPLGVAGSVDQEIFKPYYPEFQAIADTLGRYPLALAIVSGGADGQHYRQSNDAKNPALALGRAHALRSLLMNEFHVDSSQITLRSEDFKEKGPQYRYASVRVTRELNDLESRVGSLAQVVDTLINRPPVEKHFTEIKEVAIPPIENWSLLLSGGVTSSPFGGIPIAQGAVTYKKLVYFEAIVGHTFWNNNYTVQTLDLDCRRRLFGGHLLIYPWKNLPVGILGGWVRIEQISQDYYEYVRLSEGPVFGVRLSPLEFISVTGAYNPSKHRLAGQELSDTKNGQFLVSIVGHISFGGEK